MLYRGVNLSASRKDKLLEKVKTGITHKECKELEKILWKELDKVANQPPVIKLILTVLIGFMLAFANKIKEELP